jgi:outer membrane protein with beta-barrel domain
VLGIRASDDRADVKRLVCGILLSVAAGAAAAAPGWWVSADVEHFRWDESSAPSVTETGPRYGLSWGYRQERPAGWQFGYRGQFRRGTVDYNGAFLISGQPTTARSQYTDLLNEAQAIYRFAGRPLQVLGALGFDYWERKILPAQREDYAVVYARLGLNFDRRQMQGFFAGAGFKLPLAVSENAHLDELGFDQNPRLDPKGELSAYAELGYRFTPRWALIGYYDGYRFRESGAVNVTTSDPQTCGARPRPCRLSLFQPASSIDTYGLRVQYSFP